MLRREVGRDARGRGLRRRLKATVDRRLDRRDRTAKRIREPRLRRRQRAVHDGAHEVRRAEHRRRLLEDNRLGHRRLVRRRVDDAGVEHPPEQAVAPVSRPVEVAGQVVVRRPPREADDEGRLGGREATRRRVEIRLARGGDAAQVGAEGDAVQVLLEDRALRERRLDPQRQRHLAELAREVARVGANCPRELHRQRRPAGNEVARPHVADEGADEGAQVDARVLVESTVLHRDERRGDERPAFLEAHPARAGSVVGAHLAEQVPVAIGHAQRVRLVRVEELRRQRRQRRRREERQRRQRDDRRRKRGCASDAPDHRCHGRASAICARAAEAATTSNVPAAVRPVTSGEYMQRISAGGATKCPRVDARAR